MKILIVEDDFINRLLLQELLTPYGECNLASDGQEALEAFDFAMNIGRPYDLICMDIVMPGMGGQAALKEIREREKKLGIKSSDEVKVLMISALGDPRNVVEAFYTGGATAYIVKPLDKTVLIGHMEAFGLMEKPKVGKAGG